MTAGQFFGIPSRLRVVLSFDEWTGTEREPRVAKLQISKQGEGVKIDGAWRAAIIEFRWSAEARCREQLKLLKCKLRLKLELNLGIVSTRLPNLASIFAVCYLLFFRITILRVSALALRKTAFTCTVSFVLRAPSVTYLFEPCSPRLRTSAQQSPLRCLPPWTASWIKNGADTSRSDLTRPRASTKTYKLAPIAFDDQ
jgi:hypothetical protein